MKFLFFDMLLQQFFFFRSQEAVFDGEDNAIGLDENITFSLDCLTRSSLHAFTFFFR